MLEFDDEEDMELLRDIGEKAHYLSVTHENGKYRVYILIKLLSGAYERRVRRLHQVRDNNAGQRARRHAEYGRAVGEDKATAQLIKEILDRFDNETNVDRTTAFRAVVDYLVKEESAEITRRAHSGDADDAARKDIRRGKARRGRVRKERS